MLRIFLCSLLAMFSYGISFCQQEIVDSLESLLPKVNEVDERVLLLGDLSYYASQINPKLGLQYADQLVDFATEQDHDLGLMNGFYKQAVALMNMGNYYEALDAASQARDISVETRDTSRLLFCLDLLGIIYTYSGNFELALDDLFEAARLAELMGDKERAGGTYNNIGELYYRSRDIENAKEYFMRALPLLESTDDRYALPTIYLNLSLVEKDLLKKKLT